MPTVSPPHPSSPWSILCVGLLLSIPPQAAAESGAPAPLAASAPRVVATGDGTWTENLPSPRERSKQAAVYDGPRKRMIMFGGKCQDACCPNGPVGDDVWALMLDTVTPRWVQVRPTGVSPGAGLGPAAIYDSVRQRMLVAGATGSVWALSLAGAPVWSQLAITGTGPSPTTASAVYDPVRDQMIVVMSSGTWVLPLASGSQWTQPVTTGKAPTGVVSAIYDPVRDRVVVFADSVRALTLSGSQTWSLLTNNPMPRSHTAIYDPVRDRVVLHGGCVAGGCGFTETWEMSLSGTPAWTQLSTAGPLVGFHSAVYDPLHDRMVVFGGYAKQFYTDWSSRELWTLSLDPALQWNDFTPRNPPRACAIPAVRDPVRSRVIAFDDSVRTMSLVGLPDWSTVLAGGTAPSPRQDYSAVYDPLRDRLVLFGGWVWSGAVKQQLTDLWSLSLSSPEQWAPLSPAGTPPVSSGPAVYDPVHDRMLVFGPQRVWQLGFAAPLTWSEIVPTGTPPPVDSGFTAVYDPVRNRALVFGGGGAGGLVSDTWELSLAAAPAWNTLAPSGAPPAPRTDAMAIYDPTRDRMVISGGALDAGTLATDTWALTLGSGPVWVPLATDGAAPGGLTALYDPGRDRMVTLGTCAVAVTAGCPDPEPGLWGLWFGGVLGVPAPQTTSQLALAQNRPNPTRGPATIEFSLGQRGSVSLRVYDLSGRVIRTLIDGALERGDHGVRWDGRRSDGSLAQPGAYFYELRTNGERLARRLVLLQ
jgi:hypothetical protein